MPRRLNRDLIAARIHKDIIMREIPAGAPIDEAELAASMNVSRTPIREVVHLLGGKGLLVHESSGGFRTPVFGIREIMSVFQAAAVVYPEVFAHAGAARQPENIQAIDRALDDLEACAGGSMTADTIAAHRAFVSSCAAATQNSIFIGIMAQLIDRYTMIRNDTLNIIRPETHHGHEDRVLSIARRIRQLIVDGETEGLRAAARERVETTQRFILTHLGVGGAPVPVQQSRTREHSEFTGDMEYNGAPV